MIQKASDTGQVLRAVNKCTEHLTASKPVPLFLFVCVCLLGFCLFCFSGVYVVCVGPQLHQGSCISLDVFKLVDLNYCGGSIKA